MFSVTQEDKGFTATLETAVGLTPGSFAPEFARLGQQYVADVRDGFVGERDPYGQKWAPLAKITVIDKREKGSPTPEKILQDTGALLRSFQYEVVPEGLSIFSDRVFPSGVTAEIHQFGGTHPRTLNFIPAREMLPFSKGLPVEWMQLLEVFTDVGVERIFK